MSQNNGSQVYTQGTGTTSTDLFYTFFSTLDPSSYQINFPVQKRWVNTATRTEWVLAGFNSSNGVITANWINLGGGTSSTEYLQGNSGGPVSPSNNIINVVGDGTTINITGSPSTNTLTASIVSPLNVAYGGTGAQSLVPYSLLVGGTTSTGAVQSVSSVGTAGQILVSNGPGVLPTWQTASTSAFAINFIAFATEGTYTYTPTANTAAVIVEVIGAGGAGGGVTGLSTSGAVGGGGGAGAYIKSQFTALEIGASQTITVGAGGVGNTGIGGDGGDSSFGTLLVATGGKGGLTINSGLNVAVLGGEGGASSAGPYASVGSYGFSGTMITPTAGSTTNSCIISGAGASTIYGQGGYSLILNSGSSLITGAGGVGIGAGGSGAVAPPGVSGSAQGGAGSAGAVLITEFIN